MIRTIIIDDEPLAIDSLAHVLKNKCGDDVRVIATCNSPKLAKSIIEEHKPDLVFTDVEMPGMSGIDLIRSFGNPEFHVVFITAYDAYAVEAFRLSAMDYLLKPVDAEDIVTTIAKVKNAIRKNENFVHTQLQNLEKILAQNHAASESKIGIGMAEKIVFVEIAEIVYCKAEGAYTHVFLSDGKKIVASRSLGEFENQLKSQKFFRIHHSILVNLRHIKEFQRFDGGYVIMDNNSKLEVSHRKRNDFLNAIDGYVV
jgi:two-component system LytT family response regulator